MRPPHAKTCARSKPLRPFDLQLIRKAHSYAVARRKLSTDDAGLVEQIGMPVKVIPGEIHNLKITTEDDLILAGTLLRKIKLKF